MRTLRIPPLPAAQWTQRELSALGPREGPAAESPDAAAAAARIAAAVPEFLLGLVRHPGIVDTWRSFGWELARRGVLDPAIRELVTLRVAWKTDCATEWDEHELLGRELGLSDPVIEAARSKSDFSALTEEQRLALTAVDELTSGYRVSDGTWQALAGIWDYPHLIELIFLAGHYVMLAGVINSLYGPVPGTDAAADG